MRQTCCTVRSFHFSLLLELRNLSYHIERVAEALKSVSTATIIANNARTIPNSLTTWLRLSCRLPSAWLPISRGVRSIRSSAYHLYFKSFCDWFNDRSNLVIVNRWAKDVYDIDRVDSFYATPDWGNPIALVPHYSGGQRLTIQQYHSTKISMKSLC